MLEFCNCDVTNIYLFFVIIYGNSVKIIGLDKYNFTKYKVNYLIIKTISFIDF